MKKFCIVIFCFLFTSFNVQYSQALLKKSNISAYIQVTTPNNGGNFTKGESIKIRWKSNLINGNVKIKLKWGTGSGGWYPISNSAANTGYFKYDIPEKGIGHHGDQFKIFVMSSNEKIQDSSDKMFTILNKQAESQVDLTCNLTILCNKRQNNKFEILISVKNKGTRILRDVLFEYIITRKNSLIKQDGAGFGLMHPGIWYKARYTFKPEDLLQFHKWRDKKRAFYTVKLYVDPFNNQHEPQHLREDNTIIKKGICFK